MSTTIPIPGGTATLRDPGHPTVRDKRRAQVLALRIGSDPDFAAAMASAEGENTPVSSLSDRALDIIGRTGEIRVLNLLESWTIDRPLPQWFDDLDDLPLEIFAPIEAEATRLAEEADAAKPKGPDGRPISGFDHVEDPSFSSPTGATADSNVSSAVARRRAPSDRKKPASSKSSRTAIRSAG